MLNELAPRLYARLRERRKRSQAAFGELFGKSRETVSNWERGETRPSYEDERLLFEGAGCSWQEALEISSEVLSELCGRRVSLEFEDRDNLDHPEHPLTRAEQLLRQRGQRLPGRLLKLLQRMLLKARTQATLIERDNAEALEVIELFLEQAAAGAGSEPSMSTEPEGGSKRWGIFRQR